MAAFSLYLPDAGLSELERQSVELKIPCVELGENFLNGDAQSLLRARYVSGLRYVCLRMNGPVTNYSIVNIKKAALWCEANYIDAILFSDPGGTPEAAAELIEELSVFRVKIVFENKNGSFLTTPDEMEKFFRAHRDVLLSYNPAEMVSQRIHPFLDALNGRTYRRQLFMIRVYDRCYNGTAALPYRGDSELAECFSAAAGFGIDCYASVSPYAGFGCDEIKSRMCEVLCRI